MSSTTPVISVLVVDDHPVVLDGVRHLVDSTPWITLAAYARCGREAITLAEQTQPHVVLLDLRLPDMLGPEVIRGIQCGAPGSRIILFTAYPDHAAVQPALAAGAQAVVLKDADRADLVDIIRRVAYDVPLGPESTAGRQLAHRLRQCSLTRREYEILRHISMGETNPEIAESLGLTRNTVKTYVQSALSKLGARNRIEALNRLNELGLL